MDDDILNLSFRDDDGIFNRGAYEDAVSPIVEQIFYGKEVDTSGMTLPDMYSMAVDIAKKREKYTPVKKTNKDVNCKNKYQATQRRCALNLLLSVV